MSTTSHTAIRIVRLSAEHLDRSGKKAAAWHVGIFAASGAAISSLAVAFVLGMRPAATQLTADALHAAAPAAQSASSAAQLGVIAGLLMLAGVLAWLHHALHGHPAQFAVSRIAK